MEITKTKVNAMIDGLRLSGIVSTDGQRDLLHLAGDMLDELWHKWQGLVVKLPKTADGVVVVPGMRVFLPPGVIGREVRAVVPVLCGPMDGVCDDLLGEVEKYEWTFSASHSYSTREAAQAAADAAGGDDGKE